MTDRFEPIYSIGEAAKKLGIVVPLLRNLEKAGVLLSARTSHGKRLFSECDLKYLQRLLESVDRLNLDLDDVHRKLAETPCWEILKCEPEIRSACPRYFNYQEPCWMQANLTPEQRSERCHSCPVYRSVSELITNRKK